MLTPAEKAIAQGDRAELKFYGNDDKSVSPFLKAWISQPDFDKKISTCVIGLIGPGTSRSLQSNWNSPFEQTNVGGMFEKTAGLAQVGTGLTSITTLSSTQVWDGNRPNTFTLNLIFYALKDADMEVMLALRELEKMMGPNIEQGSSSSGMGISDLLKSAMPGGNIPNPVVLNIGRRMMIPNCVIENMQTPLDKERTIDGALVRAEVNISLATKIMLNRDAIAKTW